MSIGAYGTTLLRGASAIANVRKLDGFGAENSERDTTDLSSTSKTQRPTKYKTTPLSGECLMSSASFAIFMADVKTGTKSTWKLNFPSDDDGNAVADDPAFDGWVSKAELTGIEPDGTIAISFEITPVGELTL